MTPESAVTRAHTVIVIAKQPVPGRVKTRLQTRFSPQEAAALAAASLADSFAAVLDTDLTRRVVALDGTAGPWLPPGFEVVGQGAGGLDQRLEHAFAQTFAVPEHPVPPQRREQGDQGAAEPVLLIGMDTPQVTPALLAADWGDADAVLGLCPDGGFWAVGLRHHVPGAFVGVPMSTDHTGADQLRRLRSLGLRVRLLPMLDDVDTPDDARAMADASPHTRFAAEYRRLTSGSGRATSAPREVHPLELYAAALDGVAVHVETTGGHVMPLDAARWIGQPDHADLMLLSRCEGAVLDLGCGPGRLVGALAATGAAALGVDICEAAVARTTARGASALLRSVQDRLPAEGRWGTVLLADGNIGIGGDPEALLRRCAALLRPMGLLLVEADPDDVLDVREQVWLVADRRRARPMPWARLGCAALVEAARASGFLLMEEWRAADRVFLALRSAGQRLVDA